MKNCKNCIEKNKIINEDTQMLLDLRKKLKDSITKEQFKKHRARLRADAIKEYKAKILPKLREAYKLVKQLADELENKVRGVS